MNKIEVDGYRRVSKNEARNLFDAHEGFFIFPCKVLPSNQWGIGAKIEKNDFAIGCDFDRLVDAYEQWNCQYNEWGKYASFYVKEGE